MYHTTKEGKTMLIASMDDNHLKNTINFIIGRIKFALAVLNQTQKKTVETIVFANKNIDRVRENNKVMEIWLESLPKYIFEATIRGFDYTKEIQDLLWRSWMIEWYEWYLHSLPNNSYDEEYDLDYND